MRRRTLLATGTASLFGGCTARSMSPSNGCPTVSDAATTICGDAPITLTADASEVSLPRATVTFQLHNRSGDRIGVTVSKWTLHRRTADEWQKVASPTINPTRAFIDDGDTIKWTLTVDEGSVSPRSDSDATSVRIGNVVPGAYAFAVRRDESDTAYVATFEVRG